MAKMISHPFLQALFDAGIADINTKRVVIDIQYDEPVKIYLEKFGDDKLLNVFQSLDGVVIIKEG